MTTQKQQTQLSAFCFTNKSTIQIKKEHKQQPMLFRKNKVATPQGKRKPA